MQKFYVVWLILKSWYLWQQKRKTPAHSNPLSLKNQADFLSWHGMRKKISDVISLGFGSGLSPVMPGTVGSLLAFLTYAFLFEKLNQTFFGIFLLILFPISVWAIQKTQTRTQKNDGGYIVIDEIWACWLLLWVNQYYLEPLFLKGETSSMWFLFIFFRIFDMLKPWPIRWIDTHFKQYATREFKSAFGVMIDDVLAAVLTLLVAYLWYH